MTPKDKEKFKYKEYTGGASSRKNIDYDNKEAITVSSPLKVLLEHGFASSLVSPENMKIKPKNYKKIKKIWNNYRKSLNVSS